ncbi:MAG: methylenetetrahydrofolate reductase C-terminal domain-containing protein [Candidatus Schekmanbacteria bacterium]|nr:methylenetetrahydrofolate reductase C-terminal domain-containing protein [Candidatus Schekmanbacteria bacterium]
MIVAQRKPLQEIIEKLEKHKKVLIAGCATCVAECRSGGQKEVELLASQLRIAFADKKISIKISECCIERQCEPEMIEEHAQKVLEQDVVLSIACGVGVQEMSLRFADITILPGLNTTFMGTHAKQNSWEERCGGCGNCILDLTMGICPIARCSKSLLNGPCGGTHDGKCEISEDTPCAWALIVERHKEKGKLEQMESIIPPKDWSTSRDGGPRVLAREELE